VLKYDHFMSIFKATAVVILSIAGALAFMLIALDYFPPTRRVVQLTNCQIIFSSNWRRVQKPFAFYEDFSDFPGWVSRIVPRYQLRVSCDNGLLSGWLRLPTSDSGHGQDRGMGLASIGLSVHHEVGDSKVVFYWTKLWIPLVLFAPYPTLRLISMARWTFRRRARVRSGMCARCGYNLLGNVSGKCPECGTPAPSPPIRAIGRY
jgi:hypothetical protein